MRGQHAQDRPQDLRSQIGRLALGGEQQKPAVLDNQFQPRHPLGNTPANPPVPVFEGVTGRTPDEEGRALALVFDNLPLMIARPPAVWPR